MIPVLVKFGHIIGISIWAAGLICLPFLYLQRRKLADNALYRLHNFTRFLYVALISPAAFVAVGSGIGLIFLEETFQAWFSLKLALVAAMVIIHITNGAQILKLFEPGQTYPVWRFAIACSLTTIIISLILFVVLGKPQWTTPGAIERLLAPGALGNVLGELTAWSR